MFRSYVSAQKYCVCQPEKYPVQGIFSNEMKAKIQKTARFCLSLGFQNPKQET